MKLLTFNLLTGFQQLKRYQVTNKLTPKRCSHLDKVRFVGLDTSDFSRTIGDDVSKQSRRIVHAWTCCLLECHPVFHWVHQEDVQIGQYKIEGQLCREIETYLFGASEDLGPLSVIMADERAAYQALDPQTRVLIAQWPDYFSLPVWEEAGLGAFEPFCEYSLSEEKKSASLDQARRLALVDASLPLAAVKSLLGVGTYAARQYIRNHQQAPKVRHRGPQYQLIEDSFIHQLALYLGTWFFVKSMKQKKDPVVAFGLAVQFVQEKKTITAHFNDKFHFAMNLFDWLYQQQMVHGALCFTPNAAIEKTLDGFVFPKNFTRLFEKGGGRKFSRLEAQDSISTLYAYNNESRRIIEEVNNSLEGNLECRTLLNRYLKGKYRS